MKLFVTIYEETMEAAIRAIHVLPPEHDGVEVRAERFPFDRPRCHPGRHDQADHPDLSRVPGPGHCRRSAGRHRPGRRRVAPGVEITRPTEP